MNFLKASKYLSVGKWEICEYISVCQRMKSGNISVLKKTFFSESLFLCSLLGTLQSAQAYLLLYFSMTQLAVKKINISHDTHEVIFWEDWFFCLYFDILLLFSSCK